MCGCRRIEGEPGKPGCHPPGDSCHPRKSRCTPSLSACWCRRSSCNTPSCCVVLCCVVLCCVVLCCVVLCCVVLCCVVLCCVVLCCVVLCCVVLRCVVLCCVVLCRRRCYQMAKGRDVYPRAKVNGLGCVCCVRAVCRYVALGRRLGEAGRTWRVPPWRPSLSQELPLHPLSFRLLVQAQLLQRPRHCAALAQAGL